MKKLLNCLLFCTLSLSTVAYGASIDEVKVYIRESLGKTTPERLSEISAHFIGSKYKSNPLGEGSNGKYNQNPLYRFDAFDCTTFVETMMALAVSQDFSDFEININKIRYHLGNISYTSRNHITETDWIPNNIMAGFIQDVTDSLIKTPSVAQTIIDKPHWYEKRSLRDLILPGANDDELHLRLRDLHLEGNKYNPELSHLSYLSLATIFNTTEGFSYLDKIPSGSVINIVRPNWDKTTEIGTHLNISHQGLAIRNGGKLYFRHASPSGQVNNVLLQDYLRPFINHPSIKGINVNQIIK